MRRNETSGAFGGRVGSALAMVLGVGLAVALSACGSGTSSGAPSSSGTSAATSAEVSSSSPSGAPAGTRSAAATGPVGLLAGHGGIWAASAGGDEVVRIDPATAQVTARVATPGTPLRLADDGRSIWVTAFRAGRVLAIDPTAGRVVHDVEVPGGPEGVVAAFGSVWVVAQDARQLVRLSPAGAVQGRTALTGTPRLVAADTDALYVSDYAGGTLTRIGRDGTASAPSPKLCDGAQAMAVRDGVIWVTCTTGNEVVAVDPATLRVRGRVAVPGQPDGIRADAAGVWVLATVGPTLVQLGGTPDAPTVSRSVALGTASGLADEANVDLVLVDGLVAASSFRDGRVLLVPAAGPGATPSAG